MAESAAVTVPLRRRGFRALWRDLAYLEARIGRQECEADANDALDARSDCVGLCGPDLKDCGTAAKVALKACKETAKIELAGCENEVATQLDADHTACAQDSADCVESCVQ